MAQQPKNVFRILTVDDQGRLVAEPDAVEQLGLRPGTKFLAAAEDELIVLTRVRTLEEVLNDPDWADWDDWDEEDNDSTDDSPSDR